MLVCSRNRPGLTQLRGRRAWSAVDIRQAIVDAYRIHVLENEELTHDQFVAEVQTAHLDSFLPEEFLPEPTLLLNIITRSPTALKECNKLRIFKDWSKHWQQLMKS